ncbi:hypothetical protein AGMMS49990_02700 [Endomicrobiia bacterium]|nr:hypothetical protein AGMMS49990_02700 [Endomicrobiia bacterium]
MSIADSEMRRKNYGKAAEYYENAVEKKPGDRDAVMGYALAAISDALGESPMNILEKVATGKDNEALDLLSKLVSNKKTNEIVTKLTDDENMFPKLFEGSNPPTDGPTNTFATVIYILRGLMPLSNNPDLAAQASIKAIKNGDFDDVDIKDIPIQKETRDYIGKSFACMNRVGNNGVIKELGSKLLNNC